MPTKKQKVGALATMAPLTTNLLAPRPRTFIIEPALTPDGLREAAKTKLFESLDLDGIKPEDTCVGYISREHTFWCGTCGNWEQFAERHVQVAIVRATARGWMYHPTAGWLCKKHAPKETT